jgi:hypothetical protein
MTPRTPDYAVVTYEADAARNRSSFSFWLLLLALLPYVYVLTVLGVILALFGLLLWTIISGEGRAGAAVRIEIALAVVAGLFLRSIWVRVPPPTGLTLPEKEPTLTMMKIAHEVAGAIRGPKVQEILWTDGFSVSIGAVPRVSLLGGPLRYYLQVGLPVLHMLSPEQLRAHLAYELGLFAGAHGRFRSWLGGYWFSWSPLLSALTSRGRWGSWLFSRFFAWYVPFFLAQTNDADRFHTYEADRCGADVTSAEVMAEVLLLFEYAPYVEDMAWDEDQEKANEESGSYTYIADLLRRQWPESAKERWMDHVLEQTTKRHQLRPALKDRLAALGQTVHVPAPIAQSAAEAYLGEHLPAVNERLVQDVQERMAPDFVALDGPVPTEYELGTQAQREDREECVALLERAMELEPNLTVPACAQLATYYLRQGDVVIANRYSRRSTQHERLYDKAIAERSQVSFIESFLPHDLSESEVQQLRTELARHKEVKAAYLVRKEVTYVPEKPVHALGLILDRGWLRDMPEDISFARDLSLVTEHPPKLYTFVLDYKNRRVGNMIRNVANSLIYKNPAKNFETQ